MNIKEIIGNLACGVCEGLTPRVCRLPGQLPPSPDEPQPEPELIKPVVSLRTISADNLVQELNKVGLSETLVYPQPLDFHYYYPKDADWGAIIDYIYTKYEFPQWETSFWDCDDFAKLFWALMSYEFKVSVGFVIGTVPNPSTGQVAGHAFNLIMTDWGIKLWEPCPDFPWGLEPLNMIGDTGYWEHDYKVRDLIL